MEQMEHPREITVRQAMDAYLEEIGKSRSEGTRETYGYAVSRFGEVLGASGMPPDTTPVSELRAELIEDYLDDLRELAPTTERLYIIAVVGLVKFVMAKRWADPDRLNAMQVEHYVKTRRRKIPTRVHQFPLDEINALLEGMDAAAGMPAGDERERLRVLRDRAFIYMLTDTGLRVSEACSLRRGDVNFQEALIYVIGKGDKEALVRVSERSLHRLRAYLDARAPLDAAQNRKPTLLPLFAGHAKKSGERVVGIGPRSGQNILKEWVGRILGEEHVHEITPHTLRHYFVTVVLRSTGGDVQVTQRLARHSNISTTMRYAHLKDDEVDEAYYEAFGGGGEREEGENNGTGGKSMTSGGA